MSDQREPNTFTRTIRFAWRYWRRRPVSLALVGTGLLGVTVMQIFQPYLAGRLVDAVAQGPDDPARAVTILGLFVGAILAVEVFRLFRDYVWISVATHAMTDILNDAFVRVQRFSTEWHANTFAGSTVRKLTRGQWAFDEFGDTLLYGFAPTTLVLIGTVIMLTTQWPMMGLFAVPAILAYLAASITLNMRYVAPEGEKLAERDSELGGMLADAVTCNATVKSFGAERREEARTRAEAGRWRMQLVHTWQRHVNASVCLGTLRLFFQAGLLGIALWFWAEGRASPGQVTLVLTTYLLLDGYLRDLGMHMQKMQKALNEAEDVVLFADMAPDIADLPDARIFRSGKGRIEFSSVDFGYPGQKARVYRGFSIRIEPGERVALVGRSGSGKSTFVKLVQRLHDVDGGRVLIDGQDVAWVTQESLRRAIALVPQEPILFHRSIAENIAYARPEATIAEIEAAAARAHAHDFIRALPNGYGTLVGERGVKLSGGERQRVAIARAFLADAPILILDEATSSLDSITERHIQAAIEDLMVGRTTILIAHRLSTIEAVDRILVFAGGRVVEQGTHDALMARPGGHYRALYATQYGLEAMSA